MVAGANLGVVARTGVTNTTGPTPAISTLRVSGHDSMSASSAEVNCVAFQFIAARKLSGIIALICEDRLQGRKVPVNVIQRGDAHAGSLARPATRVANGQPGLRWRTL